MATGVVDVEVLGCARTSAIVECSRDLGTSVLHAKRHWLRDYRARSSGSGLPRPGEIEDAIIESVRMSDAKW
jgi:hypothetical protein